MRNRKDCRVCSRSLQWWDPGLDDIFIKAVFGNIIITAKFVVNMITLHHNYVLYFSTFCCAIKSLNWPLANLLKLGHRFILTRWSARGSVIVDENCRNQATSHDVITSQHVTCSTSYRHHVSVVDRKRCFEVGYVWKSGTCG